MNKILIVCPYQFGYHTDYYNYCRHLKKDLEIRHICFYQNKPKIYSEGIKTTYISSKNGKFKRQFRYIIKVIKEIYDGNYDLIFLNYTKFCFLIRLFNFKQKMVLDIRTGNVLLNNYRRFLGNKLILFESLFFDNITVISNSLVRRLRIKPKNFFLLPVGANMISCGKKSFKSLNLFYVGTLVSRNIECTLEGLEMFLKDYRNRVSVKYDIVGWGYPEVERELNKSIKKYNLENYVTFWGRKYHDELIYFRMKNNIGIAYIPITDYYDCQPSTKLFEYLLSGMAVIATNTKENKKVVNDCNGVLINDTAEGFYNGLKKIYENKDNYCSTIIQKSFEQYTWDNIVSHLAIFIKKIIHS